MTARNDCQSLSSSDKWKINENIIIWSKWWRRLALNWIRCDLDYSIILNYFVFVSKFPWEHFSETLLCMWEIKKPKLLSQNVIQYRWERCLVKRCGYRWRWLFGSTKRNHYFYWHRHYYVIDVFSICFCVHDCAYSRPTTERNYKYSIGISVCGCVVILLFILFILRYVFTRLLSFEHKSVYPILKLFPLNGCGARIPHSTCASLFHLVNCLYSNNAANFRIRRFSFWFFFSVFLRF